MAEPSPAITTRRVIVKCHWHMPAKNAARRASNPHAAIKRKSPAHWPGFGPFAESYRLARLTSVFGDRRLSYFEILRGFLPAVRNNLILNVLAFVERAQARPFHGRDMHEHIFAAALRLDKAITLGRVEPLYSASSHISLQVVSRSPKPTNAGVTFALGMIPIPEIALGRYPGRRFR
jgi:hypothetical protein